MKCSSTTFQGELGKDIGGLVSTVLWISVRLLNKYTVYFWRNNL